MCPLEPVEREQAAGRVAPPDARHRDAIVAGEVPPEGLGVAGLLLVVELEADRAAELVDQLARVDEVELADALARDARRRRHQLEVGLDLACRVRTLHLDDHLDVVGQRRTMHLADRRRRDRRLVEVEERLLDGEAELLPDDALDLPHRDRRDVVLELSKLPDDVRWHDVRAGREQLPELDERRAELVEHLAQPAPPVAVLLAVPRTAAVEEVAEPVPRGDAPDLRDARERPLLAGVRHRLSVARSGDAVPLEQPQSMLELRDAEREVLDLLAAREPRLGERPFHRLVAPCADALELRAPRGDGVAHRLPHGVTLDPDASRQVVGDLLHRLHAHRRPADTGEEQLGDGPRLAIGLGAHRAHSTGADTQPPGSCLSSQA